MKKRFPLLFVVLILAACQDDDGPEPLLSVDCGEPIFLTDQTDVPASDAFDLIEVSTSGLCMDVTIGASGCSMDGWAMQLRSNGEVAESLPTQTSARLIFDDGVEGNNICLAYFTVTYTFNLSDYLSPGALPSNLTLTGPGAEQTTVFFE
jgi:hypothetical protein